MRHIESYNGCRWGICVTYWSYSVEARFVLASSYKVILIYVTMIIKNVRIILRVALYLRIVKMLRLF